MRERVNYEATVAGDWRRTKEQSYRIGCLVILVGGCQCQWGVNASAVARRERW